MSDNIYGCKCGCLLLFEDYELGYEIYIGNNKYCLSDNKIYNNYNWSEYIKMNEYETWRELKEDIILNYNNKDQYDNLKDFRTWTHLYNNYCIDVSCIKNIDENEKFYFNFII